MGSLKPKEFASFNGAYEKCWYDIKLANGKVIRKCWPDAGEFHVMHPAEREKSSYPLEQVKEFRVTSYKHY